MLRKVSQVKRAVRSVSQTFYKVYARRYVQADCDGNMLFKLQYNKHTHVQAHTHAQRQPLQLFVYLLVAELPQCVYACMCVCVCL